MDLNNIIDLVKENATQLVTDNAKKELFNYIQNKGFGTLKDVAESYSTALQESATGGGWVYIRDKFFIPTVISLALSILSGIMNQIASEMGASENA